MTNYISSVVASGTLLTKNCKYLTVRPALENHNPKITVRIFMKHHADAY